MHNIAFVSVVPSAALAASGVYLGGPGPTMEVGGGSSSGGGGADGMAAGAHCPLAGVGGGGGSTCSVRSDRAAQALAWQDQTGPSGACQGMRGLAWPHGTGPSPAAGQSMGWPHRSGGGNVEAGEGSGQSAGSAGASGNHHIAGAGSNGPAPFEEMAMWEEEDVRPQSSIQAELEAARLTVESNGSQVARCACYTHKHAQTHKNTDQGGGPGGGPAKTKWTEQERRRGGSARGKARPCQDREHD